MINIKEKFWKTGNIFEFNNGRKRLVWNDSVIDASGCVPKFLFDDELNNTDSTVGECVIRIYSPNTKAGYFKELIKTKDENLLWQKSKYIFTEEEIKEKLGIPNAESLIIIANDI